MGDWYDTLPGAYSRNVGRMLQGVEFTVGDDEHDMEERTVRVERLVETAVGFDSSGIFAGVVVADGDGLHWTLYNDGSIADSEDVYVGRHRLAGGPDCATLVAREVAA